MHREIQSNGFSAPVGSGDKGIQLLEGPSKGKIRPEHTRVTASANQCLFPTGIVPCGPDTMFGNPLNARLIRDVAQIAVGKKVFCRGCKIVVRTEKSIQLFIPMSAGIFLDISPKSTMLNICKPFISNDGVISLLAMQAHPTILNLLTLSPASDHLDLESHDCSMRYVVFRFHSTEHQEEVLSALGGRLKDQPPLEPEEGSILCSILSQTR